MKDAIDRLIEATEAVLATLGGGRDVYMGSRRVTYNATFMPDGDPVKTLRQALATAKEEREKFRVDEDYLNECESTAKAWGRETLERQYMNAVEALWVTTKALADARKPKEEK